MTVAEMLRRFERLDIEEAARQAVEETRALMIILNQRQMLEGRQSDDQKIVPKYRPLTRKYKKEKGLDPDVVTLHDEGDFYAGIEVIIFEDNISIFSKDEKTPGLVSKYGHDIFGLTGKSREQYREVGKGVFFKIIKETLAI